ncbi:MAG: hypothetical protein ACOZIN_11685 [Myxococcota bacterium]
MKNKLLAVGIFGASAALLACGTVGGPPDAGADPLFVCEGTPATVTATQLVTEVITPACKTGCHEPNGTVDLDLSDAGLLVANTVNKPSPYGGANGTLKIVEPNNPANSTFWLKILGGANAGRRGPKGESVGGPMPGAGPALDDAQKQKVKDWICTGAQ